MCRQTKFRLAAFAYLGFAALIAPRCVNPQASPTTITDRGVSSVRIRVTVMDTANRVIDGLTRDSFRVLEDGKLCEITYFSHEAEQMSVGILVDKSGSMRTADADVVAAAMALVRDLPVSTDISLIRFSDQAVLSRDHVADANELGAAIERMPSDKNTALLDAIYLGLGSMQAAKYEKRVLVIFSDGMDNGSRFSEGELTAFVRESDAQIYLIGIVPPHTPKLPPEYALGGETLREICDISGGFVVPVERISLLPDLVSDFARMLGKQYVLGFTPLRENPGPKRRWRKVAVKVVSRPGIPAGYAVTREGLLASTR